MQDESTSWGALFASAPVAGLVCSPEGVVTSVNRSFEQLLGYRSADLVGRPRADLHDRLRTAGALSVLPAALAALSTGAPVHHAELVLLDRDGRPLAASLDVVARCDEAGAVVELGVWAVLAVRAQSTSTRTGTVLRATVQDVTTARRLERDLEASEARARQLVVAMPDALVLSDHEGRISTVNQRALDLLGYDTEDELVGRPVEVLVPHGIHTRHRQLRDRHAGGDDPRPMSTGPDVVAVRRDGSTVEVDVNLSVVELPEGRAVVATLRDVTTARALQRDLQAANALFRGVLTAATEQSIIATDPAGLVTVFNSGAERLLGWTEHEVVGRLTELVFHDPAEVAERAGALGVEPGIEVLLGQARAGRPQTSEWTYLTKDGGRRLCLLTVTAMRDAREALTGFISVATDVTAARAAEAALRVSEERFRLAFEDAPIGMALIDVTTHPGRFLRVNREMCRLAGHAESDLLTRTLTSLAAPEDADVVAEHLGRLGSGRSGHVESETRYLHADGHPLWARLSASLVRRADGSPDYVVAQLEDVTVRRDSEAELNHRALHDPLTGLPNRALLMDHVHQALLRAGRDGRVVAVLFLDLDDFKLVNDSLGHDTGDDLLVALARRLQGCLRDSDTAARLGGDEFVVVCGDLSAADEARALVERIGRELRRPVDLGGHVLTPSISMGIATSDRSPTAEALLREADAAMYRAKRGGKGLDELDLTGGPRRPRANHRSGGPGGQEQVEAPVSTDVPPGIEDPDGLAHRADRAPPARALRPVRAVRAVRRLGTEGDLRRGLAAGELRLHYQPCVELATGRVLAVEALLRWQHPEQGLLLPDAFLDVAERRDLIVPIGRWVLRAACRQGAAWRDQLGDAAPKVWVNVSSRQLGRHGLARRVSETLEETGLPPALLGVELTERQALAAAPAVRADLAALPAMGVALAIDDFGTGHNGMDHLRTMPVETIKIDHSFVAGLGRDRTDTALVTGIVAIALSLDLSVVAEGVETAEQRDRLRAMGCHQAQGFLLHRPVPAAQVAGIVRRAQPDVVRLPGQPQHTG